MTLPDLSAIVPFFQPIIGANDQKTFAFEVLGRTVKNGIASSLGPFFENPEVSDAYKYEVDIHIRTLALEAYARSGSKAKLFVNLKPSWIYAQRGVETKPRLVSLLEQLSMDPRRIVVEVTEEELLGDIDVFSRIIAKYRSAGCMLAIDDFGKGSGSIDRIAYINPDIIKIDKSIVQRVDVQQSFFDVCRAMSAFGDVSGFDLLFEGVETPFQLERCVAAKGRYFQGFVFSPARPEIDSGFENRDLLNDLLCLKVYRDRVKLDQRNNIQVELGQTIEQLRPVIPMEEKRLADRNSLAELGKALPYYCIRCFICDSDGRQLSPVVNLGPRRQVTATDYTSSAWLFHEFFERGVDALHCGHKGFLSNLYKTVESKQDVVTYMHELRSDRLLCVDIMSSYLS